MQTQTPVKIQKWQNEIQQIQQWMNDICVNIEKLAKLIHDCNAKDGNFPIILHKHVKEFSLARIATFIRIGCGQVDARSLIWDCPAVRVVQMFSGATQKAIYDKNEVQVAVPYNGKVEVVTKPLNDLTMPECRQVFNEIGVKSIDEQRKWLSRQQDHRSNQPAQRYTIDKITGDLIVNESPTEFTPAQLEEIMARCKAIAMKQLTLKR